MFVCGAHVCVYVYVCVYANVCVCAHVGVESLTGVDGDLWMPYSNQSIFNITNSKQGSMYVREPHHGHLGKTCHPFHAVLACYIQRCLVIVWCFLQKVKSFSLSVMRLEEHEGRFF